MVSGFLTSPWDQARTSSAVARPIRSSSNTLTSSNWFPYFLRPVVEGGVFEDGGAFRPGAGSPAPGRRSDLLDAARVGATGQFDTELLGCPVHLLVGVAHLDLGAVGVEPPCRIIGAGASLRSPRRCSRRGDATGRYRAPRRPGTPPRRCRASRSRCRRRRAPRRSGRATASP